MNEYSSDTKKVAEKLAGMTEACANVHDDEPYATWKDVPDDLKWLAKNVEECPCAYIKKTIGGYESADMRNQFSCTGRYFTRDQWRRARDLQEAKEYCLKWDETDSKQAEQDKPKDVLVPACVCGEILANHPDGKSCGDNQDSQQDEVSEPDWDSAPEGAQYWDCLDKEWIRHDGDHWRRFKHTATSFGWYISTVQEYDTSSKNIIPHPQLKEQSQEWDGEILNGKYGATAEWEKYRVLWSGEFYLVYESESHKEAIGRIDDCRMRPIKSAEEKRRDERDSMISDMAKVMFEAGANIGEPGAINDTTLGELYDWLVSTNRLTDGE